MPEHVTFAPHSGPGERRAREEFSNCFKRLRTLYDVIVIDTPGSSTLLTRAAHAIADTLITPVNDSFVDLDVLAKVEGWNDVDTDVLRVAGPTHYSEMVWEARKQRSTEGKRPVDWIVMRNRLSSLDARNKQRVDFPNQWRELGEACGFETVEWIRAWLVEDRGAQFTLTGGLEERKVERKSFFRRLAERKGSPRIDYEIVLVQKKPPVIVWPIWREGFLCTGMEGVPQKATFHGNWPGKTFRDACVAWAEKKNISTFDSEKLTDWDCRLFDNEAEAREAFG